jgi:hypothetical protein
MATNAIWTNKRKIKTVGSVQLAVAVSCYKIILGLNPIPPNLYRMEVLTINEIKAQYPEQWVLIGNPELSNPDLLDTIVNQLVRGVVLLSSPDRREIGYKGRAARQGFDSVSCIFTGEMPKNRKWLL